MKKWLCQVCGYVHDGDDAPEKCPKCGAPKNKFEELTIESSNLIERSRLTNNLLMELDSVLARVEEIAKLGIEDKLDPACVVLFKKASEEAKQSRQSLKAEIATHIEKGKWG